MTIMVENVRPRGGHLHYESLTAPLRLSILEVKDKQLPYGGKLSARGNQKPCDGINFALLEAPGGQKGEGKLLLSALTRGRLKKKITRLILPPLEVNGMKIYDMGEKDIPYGAVTVRSGVSDISVDTSDLLKMLQKQARASLIPEPDIKEEGKSNDQDNEGPVAKQPYNLTTYLQTIKNSKQQMHIRTDMLEELKLADNVEDIDYTQYMDPTVKPKAAGAAGAEDAPPPPCATSLVIKYAGRLAALMDTSTRVVNLTDVGTWLEQLAGTVDVKDEQIELPDQPRRMSELEKRTETRIAQSPEIAVLNAQEDLRQRLGMESRTEKFIRRRRADLTAAKNLMEQKAKTMADDQKMRDYLATLDSAAAEAELATYDAPIATSTYYGDGDGDGDGGGFDDGDGGAYYAARQRKKGIQISILRTGSWTESGVPYFIGEPSSGDSCTKRDKHDKKKRGNLGRGRDRRGRRGSYGAEASSEYSPGDSSASSSQEGEETFSATYKLRGQGQEPSTSGFSSAYKGAGHRRAASWASATDVGIMSESEEIVCQPGGEETTLRSTAAQTYNEMEEKLLKLIEEVDDYVAPAQPHPEDGAAELARMRRDMIKLKRQLRFWRARSWVTQHRALLASKSAKIFTKSQTEIESRTMPTRKERDANIKVPPRRVQEFLIPKLSLRLQEQQNQSPLPNPHLVSSRARPGSKSGSPLNFFHWSGQKPQSSYASPRLILKPLEVVDKTSGQTPLLPMRKKISPLRTIRET